MLCTFENIVQYELSYVVRAVLRTGYYLNGPPGPGGGVWDAVDDSKFLG